MSEVSAYRRRNALEYLLEVFDSELILNEIMPISDNELFEIIVNIIRETEDERLKAEMVKRYNEEPNRFLLKNLIVLNVQEGLQFYIDASRTNNSICDYSDGIGEVTDAISSIYDINLLPLLLEAVRMRFSGSFQDGSFHTLYNSLQNAFLACAKTNYDLVRKSINSLKEEFSQNIEAINFCSVLQDNMIQNNKMSLIKKRSISEIQEILRHVN